MSLPLDGSRSVLVSWADGNVVESVAVKEPCIIDAATIAFDHEAGATFQADTVRLQQAAIGARWEGTSNRGYRYSAVRADTAAHVLLVGEWSGAGYHGAFAALLRRAARP